MKNIILWPEDKLNKVTAIDGDTLKVEVLDSYSIRLSRINCPEKKDKEGWLKAKQYVEERLRNAKTIKVSVSGFGKYGRGLGEVFVDGVNLNNELIEKGLATRYGK